MPRTSKAPLRLALLFVAAGISAQPPPSPQSTEPSNEPADRPLSVAETDPISSSTTSEAEHSSVTQVGAPSAPSAVVELERLRNELRSEILDYRAQLIDYVLLFFGIVITLAGFLAFGRFRAIEKDAKDSLDQIRGTREQADRHAKHISERLEAVTAEGVEHEPDQAKETAAEVRANPKAPILDKAIARAVACQQEGQHNKAIELWKSIARVSEAESRGLAARAWFSSAYLLQVEATAFRTRGDDQKALLHEEDALVDYDKAIALNPRSLPAHVNRGIAKSNLGRHEEALADYDTAIEIDPTNADAYFHRGTLREVAGLSEEARVDIAKATELRRSP